jgi:tetratricopeptide (TPR) repeat protein
MSLRRHARWVFVLLALVFAGSFVFLGVGSGSSGLGDILNGWLNNNGSGGPSVSKLEQKTREEPRNAQAFRELATAYETKQQNDDAIRALERYTALRPKDTDTLQELAGLYQRSLSDLSQQAQLIQASTPTADASSFVPASTTPLGRAYADPNGLQNPLDQALNSQVGSQIGELQTKATTLQTKLLATDKKVVALDPTDPTAQFQLAQVADATGDSKTALAAYKRFLQLSPEDPLAAQVKQRVKQLSAPATATSG